MLKKLDEANLEPVRQLRNDNRQYFFDQREITEGQQRYWYEHLYHPEIGKEEMFVITVEEEPVGTIAYKYHDADAVELGRMVLSESFRGQGLIQRAIKQLLDQLPFKQCFLEVYQDNLRAIKAYQKAGFKVVGEGGDLDEGIVKPYFRMEYVHE